MRDEFDNNFNDDFKKPKTMEKTLRLTWGDVLKWIVLIASIVSTFTIAQVRIAQLEEGRQSNMSRIKDLEIRMNNTEAQVSAINQKLTTIGDDVKAIKDAIIDDAFYNSGH